MRRKLAITVISLFFLLALGQASAQSGKTPKPKVKDLILATTTSTQDSGLLDALLPEFEKETGYRVKTIAVGTGQSLAMAEKGAADVVLCHAPEAEKKLVDAGTVTNYQIVMHNDFIIAGPPDDPAGIKGKPSVEALKTILDRDSVFISRGDDSGTNKKELSLWKQADMKPEGQKNYIEAGQGMGATLQMASEKRAYTLTDRGTYLSQKTHLGLEILSEGDKSLLNVYHVMQVNPRKFDKVNAEGAKAFVEFMISPRTQKMIGEFGKEKFGQSLFFPDAAKSK